MSQRKDSGGGEFESLAGALLLAHPGLKDPNFRQSVILLSAHTREDGALGVVINRPLGKKLGEVKEDFANGLLEDVPLYQGGPVQPEQLLLAAWEWCAEMGTFKLSFGISAGQAESMLLSGAERLEIRGFVGYSGWSAGQLEGELYQDTWVVSPMSSGVLRTLEDGQMWRNVMLEVRPEFVVMTDTPEDPSAN